jgi:hypothetical protein
MSDLDVMLSNADLFLRKDVRNSQDGCETSKGRTVFGINIDGPINATPPLGPAKMKPSTAKLG